MSASGVLERTKDDRYGRFRKCLFETRITKLARLNVNFKKHPVFSVEEGGAYVSSALVYRNSVAAKNVHTDAGKRLFWSDGHTTIQLLPEALGLNPDDLELHQEIRIDLASFQKPIAEPESGEGVLRRIYPLGKRIYAQDDWTTNGKIAIRISSDGFDSVGEEFDNLLEKIEKDSKPPDKIKLLIYERIDSLVSMDDALFNKVFIDSLSRQFPNAEWRIVVDCEIPIAAIYQEGRLEAFCAGIETRPNTPAPTGILPYKQPKLSRSKKKKMKLL